MPRAKLTQKVVNKLGARRGEQLLVWDRSLPSFGVLVSGRTNTKSYVVKGRVAGRSVRRKIARVDVMPLDAARAEARKTLLDFGAGIDPKAKAKKASAATLGAICEAYVSRASLKPRTAASYREAVARYFADWREKPIGAITRDAVEKRHRAIAAEVEARDRAAIARHAKDHLHRAERTERDWPEASARHRALFEAAKEREPRNGFAVANGAMRVLRLLWNAALDRDPSLGPNPVRLRKMWFKVPRREDLVKSDDLAKFYAAVSALPNPVQRDFVLTALFTGLRRRELAGLTWNDVDFKAGVVRLPAATTKSGRKLDLPMSDFVRDLLVARRGLGNARFVFPATSKSKHIEEPKSALAEVAASSGVRVSCHGLRRTFISHAESCDISPIALKALVNHAVGNDVTSGYVVLSTERLREAAQKVADRLATLCGIAEPAGKTVARLRRREHRDA
jgi:integrase